MTVINPNSISGIASVTAQGDIIQFYKSDGTLGAVQFDGANFNTTSGVSTFNNLYVGGVLTYEDVKNVDAIGIVTAREGIFLPDSKTIKLGNTAAIPDFTIEHNGSNGIIDTNTGDLILRSDADDIKILAEDDIVLRDNDDSTNFIHCINGAGVKLYNAGNERLYTTNTGVDITGLVGIQTTVMGRAGADELTIATTGDTGITIRSGGSNEGNIYFADSDQDGTGQMRGVIRHDHSDDSMQFFTANGNNWPTEKLRITSDGKILMGVAANNGPAAPLHIYGGSNTTPILAFTRSSVHDDWQGAGIGMVDEGGTYKGALTFYTHASSGTKNDAVTERLRITSNGHVLLGGEVGVDDLTGGAGQKGLVIGSTGEGNAGIAIINSTTGTGRIYFGDNTGAHANRKRGQICYYHNDTVTSDYMSFSTAADERLRITSAGRVGIGSEIPVAHLDVANHQNIETLRLRDRHFNKYLTIRGGGSPNRMIIDSYEGGGGGADIDFASNGSTKLRIDSSGRISVGGNISSYNGGNMSSSAANLVVSAVAGAHGGMTIVNTGNNNGNIFFANGTSENSIGRIQYEHANNAFSFTTNSYERLRINSSGDVSIGHGGEHSGSHRLWVESPGVSMSEVSFEDQSGTGQLCLAGSNSHVRLQFGTMDVSPWAGWIQASYDNTPDSSGTGNSGVEPLLLNPKGGKVGIGTDSNITGTLEVVDTGEYQIVLKDTNNAGQGAEMAMGFKDSANTVQGWVGFNKWEDDDFHTGNANSGGHICFHAHNGSAVGERLRITSGGQVNIGGDYAQTTWPLQVDIGTSNDGALRLRNDEISLQVAVHGTGHTYGREVSLNATRLDSNTDYPDLRLCGQGGIKLCVDANTERVNIASDGTLILKNNSGKMIDCRTSSGTGSNYIQLSDSAGNQKGYFGFGSGSSEQLYIVQQENADITIYNGSHSRWYFKTDGQLNSATDGAINVHGGSGNHTNDAIIYGDKTSNADWVISANAATYDYGMYARVGNSAAYGIGVYDHTNSAWRFRVNGAGTIYATSTNISSISDVRLKENIVDANSQWDDIKALRFRNFKWKADSGYADGKTYLGLISQEVEPISPNLVEINAQTKEDIENNVPDPEYKNVKYSIVWMKAVKALQEAQERIETLEAKVAALEGS